MKGLFASLLLASAVLCVNHSPVITNKKTNIYISVADTAKKIAEISIGNNLLTKGLSDIRTLDIQKDTMYLINALKGKFIKYDLIKGEVTTNKKLNLILSENLRKGITAEKIVVKNKCYYISFLNKLYSISTNGKINNIYDNTYFINDFNVIGDKIILTSRNAIKVINMDGAIFTNYPFELSDAQYIKSYSGLCYSASDEDKIYEFGINDNGSISTASYASLSLTKRIKLPSLSLSKDNFFIVFPIKNRSHIYILNKGVNANSIIKEIVLNDRSVTPSEAKIMEEEVNPDFKILYNTNNTYYIVDLVNGKLKLFSFVYKRL